MEIPSTKNIAESSGDICIGSLAVKVSKPAWMSPSREEDILNGSFDIQVHRPRRILPSFDQSEASFAFDTNNIHNTTHTRRIGI